MSAFKWLVFGLGIPLSAVVLSITYEFINPTINLLNDLSSTQMSSQGITWYSQFTNWLPFVVLSLFVFWLIVAIITRRRRVVR